MKVKKKVLLRSILYFDGGVNIKILTRIPFTDIFIEIHFNWVEGAPEHTLYMYTYYIYYIYK